MYVHLDSAMLESVFLNCNSLESKQSLFSLGSAVLFTHLSLQDDLNKLQGGVCPTMEGMSVASKDEC